MMSKLSEFNLLDINAWLSHQAFGLSAPLLMLVVSVLVFLAAALLLLRGRREFVRHLHEIRDLQHSIRAITAAAIGVGERVLELERRQRRLTERQEQLDIYDPANQSYEQAILMVKNGADAQELVDMCGISESEAELVALMHRLDQTA